MHLAEWMAREDLTHEAVGERLGVRASVVGGWLRGAMPTVPYAVAIEAMTGGAVPVRIWCEPRPPYRGNKGRRRNRASNALGEG